MEGLPLTLRMCPGLKGMGFALVPDVFAGHPWPRPQALETRVWLCRSERQFRP